ncbi:hypothetical protein [Winogradskyella rapida]|uniref:Uncharacterized protein n=1 Tax=Winogradskyella rapida TaxID=549701 RepID=A0ABW3KTK8_9FLAO
MKQTITKNEKAFKILNKLILNGFYDGSISPERFELTPTRFTNNYRLIGILNKENKFELKFAYKYPMNIASKVAIGVGILISIISMVKGNWLIPVFFFVIPFLITYIGFKIKERKEIDLFTSKYLEFYKTEYET